MTDVAPALVFPGASEMAARMRAHDWSSTAIGELGGWSQALRTAVSVMLASPEPFLIYWGPDLVVLYNDAARQMIGDKHPDALGRSFKIVFAEAWHSLGPQLERVRETGEAAHHQNLLVPLIRYGFLEDCYFTYAFVPARGESSAVEGICIFVTDTTAAIVGARRLVLLRELSLRAALCDTVEAVLRSTEEVLARSTTTDAAFTVLYELRRKEARPVARGGCLRQDANLNGVKEWAIAEVASSGKEELVDGVPADLVDLAAVANDAVPRRTLLLPLFDATAEDSALVLAVGLNPRILLDEEARSFLRQLARQLATSIASARGLEEKTERAARLAELDRAKTAFFSNVSHEFRTPLTLILGPVEDALARPQGALTGAQLDVVYRNALRLHKMVGTLLDFSRMEAGRAEPTFVPTDLAAFTVNLASNFQSAVERAGLKYVVACPPLPEAIFVDPEMWEKIVLNLLSNAVKYTHEGEIRIALAWEGHEAVLTVDDTGVGIPEEELDRVFDRFHRVRTTHGRSHEGTGIGLALVQELARLHGGTATVASKLGIGTTFCVRVPAGSGRLPADRVESSSRPSAAGPDAAAFVVEALHWSSAAAGGDGARTAASSSSELASSRILLVDDNADLRAYVAEMLRRAFPNVETATNGAEALELARARPPDLVISDVMMPVMDGFGLVRALRDDERTRGVSILLLTARAGDDPTVEGLATGADDYLVKPFSARELLARVHTRLQLARVRADLFREQARVEELVRTIAARDEFISLASHELKTPLTSLQLNVEGLLYLVEKEGLESSDGRLKTKLASTLRQTDRLGRLIEGLLDASQVSAGDLELEREDFDLADLVRAVVARFVHDARAANSSIRVEAATAAGAWDKRRVDQIVSSLVSNAVKYAPGTTIRAAVEADEEVARVVVRDEGMGISGEDLQRVFERFARGVSSANYGGLGLGLFLSRRLAEAHGGTLEATSAPESGATFTLTLPRSATSARKTPAELE